MEAARLGFLRYLRRKRFSPRFIDEHAEDLFGQACLEFSRKLTQGVEIENPPGWLIECAWRRTKSKLEAQESAPRVVSTEQSGPVSDEPDTNPEDIFLDRDRMRKVREAVQQLSADERHLLALSYFEGLSVREAARHLDWHTSKAQRTHKRARRQLHELLGVKSSDDLEVEIGLAAYASIAAEASTPGAGVLERAADGFASLKQQVADGAGQFKQHATSAYYRTVDPTPLAAARPGAVATVVAGCIALGGGATYCVEEGVNPVGAAGGLIASSEEQPDGPPEEHQPEPPPPAPVYTPAESPSAEEVQEEQSSTAPEREPEPEPKPKPKPEPEPEPEPASTFEPTSSSAYQSSETESETSYEATEESSAPAPAPAPEPAPPAPPSSGSQEFQP